MTASSVFVSNEAAYMLTDTALMRAHEPGVVWKLAPKVVQSERLRIAVAISGDGIMFEYDDGRLASPLGAIHDLFEASATQQEALAAFPGVIEQTDRTLLEMSHGTGSFRLVLALWRESGPEGYFASSSGDGLPGVQPSALVRIEEEFVFPSVELQINPNRLASDKSEAVAMIEAQRRHRWTGGSCVDHFTIGGEGQLTRVDRHGITTETIVRWHDRIGRKIDPNRRQFLSWGRAHSTWRNWAVNLSPIHPQ